jgi:hypothetical protein
MNLFFFEERLRTHAKTHLEALCDLSFIIKLLDARDKIIAEQRAVIAELSEEPITEFETLHQAHDAQNAVLARMQAELRAMSAALGMAVYALETIQHYNRVHNDLEAYLYDLAEWGMGKTDTKPDPGSYGLLDSEPQANGIA